ncbi:MAG: transposase, partial [Candidatus Brocadiaceae bacterium]|nr:transposase [Candidatus Brocadiaceae bacterium]
MLYAGLDLHKKFSYVTVMDEQGKIVSQGKLPNDQDSITEYIESIGSELKELAMEAGPSWYWLYELLDSLDINVHLAHPKRVKAIASARVKTDKIDSTVLAHLLRTNLLPEAYIPDRETWLQKELLRHRASL